MAYIPWYNRTGPITVGERFGLNEIPTRAKTLSPIKSYVEKPTYNWEKGDWMDPNDDSVGNTKILEDFVITDEMRRRPNAAGGRIALGDGSKKGKPFIDPKRVKLEKILSELPKGSIVDTGKLMDRTGVDSTRMTRLLQKYEHKNFKVIKSKRIKADIEKTGKILKTFTNEEYAVIDKLYSSEYKGLKGQKLVEALYADGRRTQISDKIAKWKSGVKVGEQLIVKPEVIKVFHELKKKYKRPPRVNEIYEKVGHLYPNATREGIINNIARSLRSAGLKWTMGVELKHSTASDRALADKIKRAEKIKEFSLKSIEDATTGDTKIHKHHMNSLRGNVTLRNIAYIPNSLNWGVLGSAENALAKLYIRRETILKKKLPGWQKALDAINAEGETLLQKLPQKARGLLNFKVVTADSSGKLKFSNKGMDWTLSVGRDVGEIGKKPFKNLTKAEQLKVIALAKENFKYASPKVWEPLKQALGSSLEKLMPSLEKVGSKAWDLTKKVGKYGIARPIAGITLPGTQIIPETVKAVKEKRLPDYNLTDPNTWVNAAFWNWAVKEWGFDKTVKNFGESLKHLSKGDKARVFRNVVARAGLSPKALQVIGSRVAWPVAGAMSVYDAYKDYKRTDAGIKKMWEEDPEGMKKQAMEDAEIVKGDTSEMFAMGGIASLIK